MNRRQFLKAAAQAGGAAAACAVFGCAAAISERKPSTMNQSLPPRTGSGHLHDAMARYVGRGGVPGIVTLVARGDDVSVEAMGVKTAGASEPVRRDTIFRISSMTKPITAAATMILVEEGKLALDDPVDHFLPELANRRVLRRVDGPLDDTVPANRPITVRDLLTFRLGFGLVMAPPDTYPIQKAVTELELGTLGPPMPSKPPPPDEWIRRFGTLPLMHQPGERWMYNAGSQVLGVLVARAAGRPLDAFLRERLFGPLGMKDTDFSVPASKLDRFATSYMVDAATGALGVYDEPEGQWSRPPAFPDGAAGLVSTVDDYLAFSRMMLAKGKHARRRILSESSVAAMTTDQLTPAQKALSSFVPGFWDERGWGFGVSIVTAPDALADVPGRYGWDGGLGTSWYADPNLNLTGILMTQRAWTSPNPPDVQVDFWASVYRS